jgi:hypothetical protein
MIQNVLRNIGGVGIYGVISICLFFIVFTGAILFSVFMKKSVAQKISTLPLDDGEVIPLQKGISHE